MQNYEMKKMLRKPYVSADEMLELVAKYKRARKQENKDRLRDQIFENNSRMIMRAVRRHPSIHKEDIDDAFNLCTVYFLRGLEKFNPKRGCKLSTYIVPWIKLGISKFLYSNNVVSIGWGAFSHESTKQKALNAGNKVLVYLDSDQRPSEVNEGRAEAIIESFFDPTVNDNTEKEIFDKIQNEQLFEMVNKNLTKREAIIIRFKYFEDKKWSSNDFKPVLKITGSMVDMIEKKALFKLKKLLQNKDISGLFPENSRGKLAYIPTEEELQAQHQKVLAKPARGYNAEI